MRSAAVALFAGLATASYLPPAPVYEQPEAPVSSASAVYPSEYPSEVVSSAEAVISSAPAETEYSTLVYTITSCAPEVTDCPAASTVVSSSVVPLTTSTIYATTVKTIHECPETVEDCPYASKTEVVVTETIAVSTTVCPVDESTPTPSASAPVYPPVVSSASSAAVTSSAPGYPIPSTTAGGNKPVQSSAPAYPVPSAPAEEEECVPSSSLSVKTILHTTVLTSYETATIAVPCETPSAPSSIVVPPPHVPTGSNGTTPAVPTYTAPVSGAAGVSGSVLVAGLAAVAAFAFA